RVLETSKTAPGTRSVNESLFSSAFIWLHPRPRILFLRVLAWFVILRIVLTVVSVVIIPVAHVFADLIERDADYVRFEALQVAEDAGDRGSARLAGEGDHNHAVHDGGHLERLGKTQERGRIHDDKVVFLLGLFQYLFQHGAHPVGGSPRCGPGGQDG